MQPYIDILKLLKLPSEAESRNPIFFGTGYLPYMHQKHQLFRLNLVGTAVYLFLYFVQNLCFRGGRQGNGRVAEDLQSICICVDMFL